MIRQLVAAFEILPPGTKEETLSGTVTNLFPPIIPHGIQGPLIPSRVTGQTVLKKVGSPNLAMQSPQRFVERRALRERRQAVPDPITELGLNEDQLRNLKARVNRRFLVGFDCSKPMDVKPVSSFIHDPCDPLEAHEKETYDIEPVTQFQVVQYETRGEFLATRCERYVSQFTYYCGAADHASPLPQETFFRWPKVLTHNDCRSLVTFFFDWKVIHLQLIIIKLIDRIMRNTKIQLHVWSQPPKGQKMAFYQKWKVSWLFIVCFVCPNFTISSLK